jgi:hypothetical protein
MTSKAHYQAVRRCWWRLPWPLERSFSRREDALVARSDARKRDLSVTLRDLIHDRILHFNGSLEWGQFLANVKYMGNLVISAGRKRGKQGLR